MEDSLKSGICSKCNHEEVYSTGADFYKILPHKFTGIGGYGGKRPAVTNYVCGNCGYAAFYVLTDDLGMVKKDWRRIGKR